jgi:alkyl hydroperoxide reductase subunit AhpC
MLGVGHKFPEFKMQACVSREKGKEFAEVSNKDMKGSWSVFFFWPLDFTFVCPTEIAEFNKELKNFQARETKLFGVSCDSHFVHLAWRNNHDDLKTLGFPMLADVKKELTGALGVLHPQELIPLRATYIVDPDGVIQWASVNGLNVGRNVKEVVRTLDALQTDELCPCNWEKGQATLG